MSGGGVGGLWVFKIIVRKRNYYKRESGENNHFKCYKLHRATLLDLYNDSFELLHIQRWSH